MWSRIGVLLGLAGGLAGPGAMAQQPLTLGRAFALADSAAYANRLAAAAVAFQAAERDQTFKGLLPSLRVEAGWTRTTDPLNAFGFSLRQRGVSQESFDPAGLNRPEPISHVGAGVVAEIPLLNPDVVLGRRAAAAAVMAAEEMARWTRATARLEVVRAYFGGVVAAEQVTVLEAGWVAAQSHVRLATSLQEQGLVTRSDVLLAQVGAGEVESRLLAARGEASVALRRLAVVLGLSDIGAISLPAALPDSARLSQMAIPSAEPRGDVAAALASALAARRNVARATATLLPRINSFGRLDWNQPDRLFGGRPSWTIGVMASWALFSGGSELVQRRAANVQAESALTRAEAAEARALLEQAERRNDLEVAIATLTIAARAVDQAVEAHRIVTRKYEGGLATVTELLDAAAVETRSRVERSAAAYRVISAAAAWRVALGHDAADLTLLDGGAD